MRPSRRLGDKSPSDQWFTETVENPSTHPRDTGDLAQAQADIAALSYEQARDQLVAIVTALETGASTLEESLALWERGEALAAHCERWLDEARKRLDDARAQATQATQDESDKAAPNQGS